ncbi:MAG TPA: D-alanyl-D-alanine carboxypeptidase family protein [Dehalococcoidia bacterium]|nr:D-alanyl-D-alanine carboxypeptidase family protein [Dehalococcoidia bacterium]
MRTMRSAGRLFREARRMVVPLAVAALVLGIVFAAPLPAAHAAPPLDVPSCASGVAQPADFATDVPVSIPNAAPAPAVTARNAVVIDGDTGRVLYGLSEHERRPPASTTKIMTAILAIEHGDLGRTVVSDVDGSTMTDSSIMGLRIGVPITIEDLLYGLMLPSGNDAALVLAENTSGSVPAFVDAMNQKAAALGLRDTHFVNPHGLDNPDHYSSAYDLAWMARYGMNNPEFAKIVGTQYWHLAPPSDYDLHNGNSLLATYPGADGVKIGWTDAAGWTLVASAVRDGHRLFVAVLDTQDRDADATALLDWAFGNFRWLGLGNKTVGQVHLAERLGLGTALFRSITVCA